MIRTTSTEAGDLREFRRCIGGWDVTTYYWSDAGEEMTSRRFHPSDDAQPLADELSG